MSESKTDLEKTREKELTAKQQKAKNLSDLLQSDEAKERISRGASKFFDMQKLIAAAIMSMQKNDALLNCSQGSFLQACMDAAIYGLIPGTPSGEAHFVPFKGHVVLVIGYLGIIKMAQNAGLVRNVTVRRVHSNDEFDYEAGLNERMVHKPCLTGEKGDFIGAYAIVERMDGSKTPYYITKEDGLAHGKKFSKTFNRGPWQTDEEAMICKTIVKMSLKYEAKASEDQKRVDRLLLGIQNSDRMDSGNFDVSMPHFHDDEIEEPVPIDVDPETGEIKEEIEGEKQDSDEPTKQESLALDKELVDQESKS